MAAGSSSAPIELSSDEDEPQRKRPKVPVIERLSLAQGLLDDGILQRVAAIAQQSNCIGCDGRGLAQAVASKLPYGCSYADRRCMPPTKKFAVPEDRAVPGTIDVRRPPAAVLSGGNRRPIVINMFAQWEMGPPGKYNRVQPAPQDSAAARQGWFASCLEAIGLLNPPVESIAFPEQIGCGLAGGDWRMYEKMITDFAARHPQTRVIIVRMAAHRTR